MMLVFALLVAVVLGTHPLLEERDEISTHPDIIAPVETSENMSFKDWMRVFAIEYDESELASREQTFNDNVAIIKQHNSEAAQGLHTHTMGVNQFTAMTGEEFKTFVSSPYEPTVQEAGFKYREFHGENPASVDWREKNAVTPVKNQGGCGSCWSFSTTGSVEGRWAIANNQLVSLSEQELVSCAGDSGNRGCNGGLMDAAFRWIEDNGLVAETTYPYTSSNGNTGTCQTSKKAPSVVSLTGYQDVSPSNSTAMESAVAEGPVSIAIEADQTAFQHYKSGVFTSTCGDKLDHGVLVVGYGTLNGVDYWIVKNSWGAQWGDQGYILLQKGADAGSDGKCGMLKAPSYPVAGNSPGPSPGPSPTPAPGSNHWADPYTGPCATGDVNVTITGVDGAMCTPACQGTTCPNAPAGFSGADPECVLQTSSGQKYCALICQPGSSGACDPSAKATCKTIQGEGICTYDMGSGPTPPTPGSDYYEDPVQNGGQCHTDETNIRIQGVTGGYCSPECRIFKPCPAVPSGWQGQAQCAVSDQSSGTKYCALICSPDDETACNDQGMTCAAIQGTGICVYPDDAEGNFTFEL